MFQYLNERKACMKKIVGVLLIALLCLSAVSVPISALCAAGIDYPADQRDAKKILGRDIPPKYEDFALSCSANDMLHGFPTATVDGVTYAFSDGKLSCASPSDKSVTTILDCCDGDNLNQLGTQLIFSATENGNASGGTKVDSSYVVNADVTLYAHWINQNAVIDSPAIIISKEDSYELSDSKKFGGK